MTKLAAIQMNSGDDVASNLAFAERETAAAADAGAELLVLPENFSFMGRREGDRVALAESDGDGPVQNALSQLSDKHDLCIIGGSVPIRVPGDDAHHFASCLVYDRGQRVARYDKIHLFDVDVPDSGKRYRESATIAPGDQPVVVQTRVGPIGLSICYDLRFPELYRKLTGDGAELLVVPSAFTHETGRAHWQTLLRARAIENLACVIGANQCGRHPGGRETWGHSMIIDPWGQILAEASSGAGHIVAEVDREQLAYTRRSFPTLSHRKLDA